MARRSHLWYAIVVRILTAIAALMSILVMVVSAWTLARILTDEREIAKLLHNSTSEDHSLPDQAAVTESEGHRTYIIILLSCLGVAILTGFSQLVASLNALCSCSKNVGGRVKGWLIVNAITFLILLLCFLLPLSFNKEQNSPRGFNDLGNEIKSHMGKLLTDIENRHIDEASLAYMYSWTIVANNLLILFIIILLGCCLRCGEYAYESVY